MNQIGKRLERLTANTALLRRRRFSLLLAMLAALLGLPPILVGLGISAAWFDAMLSLLILSGILPLYYERNARLFALIVGGTSILFSMAGYSLPIALSDKALLLGHLCQGLYFFGAALVIVRTMFGPPSPRSESIAGAVCGYLFLGLGWSVVYSLAEGLSPGSFNLGPAQQAASVDSWALRQSLTYFSFVTLTTMGYGDVVPISPAVRTFAWMEAVMGQFYLAVIVAGLVGILTARNRQS